MVDGHIHIERGSYSIEWINEFVKVALERGISEIYLLEHSHRFKEFAVVYASIRNYNEYQRDWLNRKILLSLEDYEIFVSKMRQVEFPVKVKFGLEVCYIEEAENSIRDIVRSF